MPSLRSPVHESAIRELLVRCMPGLRSYVASLIRGTGESEDDVLQELSVRVLQAEAPPYDPDGFFAWSCGIARHVVSDDRRKRRRSSPTLSGEEDTTASEAPESDPEATLDVHERLERAVDGLDANALALLIRRYVLEERASDLADEFSQSPGAVRLRLKRLRSSLIRPK